MDFLFHKISEKEKEKIKKQVDSVLESFSKKLSEIKGDIEENLIERENFEREEDKNLQQVPNTSSNPTGSCKGKPTELSKEIMFDNAPEKNKDFIIAEKKSWT